MAYSLYRVLRLCAPLQPQMSQIRYLKMTTSPNNKSLYKTESKKIRFYVVSRYMDYLKNYDKVLERSFEGAMQVYKVFTVGIKDFATDLKDYFRIVRQLNSPHKDKFQKLTRKEIELYHQMPKDMRKVAPVLLISALPLANYVIFPVAYYFPRIFLSRHFWTLQQKFEFNLHYLRVRLLQNEPLFLHLQADLPTLQNHDLYQNWAVILNQMHTGTQPKVDDILTCKDLFTCEPYHLFHLKRKHVKFLCKVHELHLGWFRRTRLLERAIVLQEMDRAICREGGVHNMPLEALKNACILRGLNPCNMRTEDMVTWLQNWIKISNTLDRESISLLLHCSLLLAYNEPSNRHLIQQK